MVLLATLALAGGSASAQPRLGSSATWLETVNYFRAASGLAPVVEEPAWTVGIAAHLRYLKLTPASYRTGEYASSHRENPDSPHYTPEGDAAGRSSNLTSGSSGDRAAIESWMVGPFHAIGVLRPNLQKVAFARDPETGAADLDVLRGLVGSSVPAAPISFPGANSGTHLTAFRGENPNPLETCGYQSAGLPLFALLPQAPAETVTADLTDSHLPLHSECHPPALGPGGADDRLHDGERNPEVGHPHRLTGRARRSADRLLSGVRAGPAPSGTWPGGRVHAVGVGRWERDPWGRAAPTPVTRSPPGVMPEAGAT